MRKLLNWLFVDEGEEFLTDPPRDTQTPIDLNVADKSLAESLDILWLFNHVEKAKREHQDTPLNSIYLRQEKFSREYEICLEYNVKTVLGVELVWEEP